jgi:carbonic anhydrase/acetyltransferase-like protein (isoleucine patch superfamily)
VLDGYFPGRNFVPFKHHFPNPSQSSVFAHNATVVGDVAVGDSSSIWFNAVVRGVFFMLMCSIVGVCRAVSLMIFIGAFARSGDTGAVRIGGNSHILDGALVAAGRGVANGHGASTHIGAYVTIGVFDV